MHLHIWPASYACTCILDLHAHLVPGTLRYVHVTTLIAALSSDEAGGAPSVDVTSASRLVGGLRAQFRRGSHRLGIDSRRQWSMTQAPYTGSAVTCSSDGRAGRDAQQENAL
jgi:hypothetical protein